MGASFRSVEHKETRARRRTLYSVLVGLWHVAIVSSLFFDPFSPFEGFRFPLKTNGWRDFFYQQDADIFILMVAAGFGFFFPRYRAAGGFGWVKVENRLSRSVDIGYVIFHHMR